jgi:hypothetical protein
MGIRPGPTLAIGAFAEARAGGPLRGSSTLLRAPGILVPGFST